MQQDEVVAHGSGSLHTTSHVFDAEVVVREGACPAYPIELVSEVTQHPELETLSLRTAVSEMNSVSGTMVSCALRGRPLVSMPARTVLSFAAFRVIVMRTKMAFGSTMQPEGPQFLLRSCCAMSRRQRWRKWQQLQTVEVSDKVQLFILRHVEHLQIWTCVPFCPPKAFCVPPLLPSPRPLVPSSRSS